MGDVPLYIYGGMVGARGVHRIFDPYKASLRAESWAWSDSKWSYFNYRLRTIAGPI